MSSDIELSWGRRYLMCRPTYFEVAYAINPWMGGVVDPALAMTQWEALADAIRAAGGAVEEVAAQPALPDMVFTANSGIVDGARLIAGRMRHAERREEIRHVARWATDAGFTVEPLAQGAILEGLGDAIPLGDVLVVGHGARSNVEAHAELTRLTGRTVLPVRLEDPRWYHVDLTLCPLTERRAIVHLGAWSTGDAAAVMAHIPEPLVLEDHEAGSFAVNSVVVGSTVVMPACPPRVGRQLEAWGLDVVVVDVGEFIKAGGAVRCLTLPLDTTLSVAPRTLEPTMEAA